MAKEGKVWLVGAGPGDPGLITVKGREVLRRADVVFFDRLVNPGILIWARPGTELVDVGKEPGGKRTEQDVIGKKIIRAARKGKLVVRLKGGDPFVFGRGGEEAEALAKARVAFEVVPGVTAGVAAPALAGIPVTHRGLSTEVDFQIGARAKGSVRGKTLVGYMSLDGLGEFLDRAVEQGHSLHTPAALISRGSCRGQKTLVSTVGNLASSAKRTDMKTPAIVVVGGVVDLQRWVGRQNGGRLAGQRVVLTMSESLGGSWRSFFEQEGAEVWDLPMIRILQNPRHASWKKKIHKARWIVLTSGAGARSLPRVFGDLRTLADKRIAVVGNSTAKILQSIGLNADFIGPGPGSESLARAWPGLRNEPILHITSNAGRRVFSDILRKKRYEVTRIEAYRSVDTKRIPKPISEALRKEGADWVVFASGLACRNLRRVLPHWEKEPKTVVIGPETARAAKQYLWRVAAKSPQPDPAAVLKSLLAAEK